MKIEVFEMRSKEDAVYKELLERYETEPELKALLNEFIIPKELVWAGDLRLIRMIDYAIDSDNINVYVVKDVDADVFVWVIGQYADTKKINMYPLLKEQSKELQLAIRNALVEKGVFNNGDTPGIGG
jgi:hypothetical protein